ncbi:hypothetical protein M9Y10_013822 [Tritrichomonas musculus]|uniref:Polymorphic outer membrane protein n=1 Tax=Tritrichomonas musculus TaxID=1915356 RepID=A0ABR2KZ09_9EUKA
MSCNFTGCRSTVEGGAISSGMIMEEGQPAVGANDLSLSLCFFTECESGSGGAIYIKDGTPEGDEETQIMSCHFISCYASSGEGHAISTRSYSFSMSSNTFMKHYRGENNPDHCILYINMNEADAPLSINYNTFEDNTGVSALTIKAKCLVSISMLMFNNYKFSTFGQTSCLNLGAWEVEGLLTLDQCKFTNITNSICISSIGANGNANFNKCEFENIAMKLPGDMVVQCGTCIQSLSGANTNLVIEGCRFTNVEAENAMGGAIYAFAESTDIKGCIFRNCKVTGEEGVITQGGAIWLDAESVQKEELIANCIFENCSSTHSGGAVFLHCYDKENSRRSISESDRGNLSVRFMSCNFTGCQSTVEGGAISSGMIMEEGQPAVGANDLSLSLCFFTECESGSGGAIYIKDGTPEGDEETQIMSCHFISCYASSGEGHAISTRSYSFSMSSNTFMKHYRGENNPDHCILYINMNEADAPLSINYNTFEDNTGVSALTIKAKCLVSISMLMFNNYKFSTFSSSAACLNLRTWEIDGTATLDQCKFINIINGRCIMMTKDSANVKISNSEFTDNSAKAARQMRIPVFGSSIYIGSDEGIINKHHVLVEGCTFTNNFVEGQGGAIYAESQGIDIRLSKFINCYTISPSEGMNEDMGGAICLNGVYAIDREFIESNVFVNCTTGYSGGALFIYCRDLEESKLLDEDPDKYAITIHNCSFTKCKSNVEGGAISSGVTNEDGEGWGDNDLSLSMCNFTECESGKGGAIYFQDGDKAGDEVTYMSSCRFVNCFAKEGEGYAISCRSYKLSMSNIYFGKHKRNANNATHSIAYISMNEEEVVPSLYHLEFEDNSGVSGLTLSAANTLTLNQFSFKNYEDNTPCINLNYWKIGGSNTVTFNGFTFENIKNARCIYMSEDKKFLTNVVNCNFKDVSVDVFRTTYAKNPDGSCILCTESGNLKVEGCNFTNAYAAACGGAIYAEAQAIDINHCRFVNCATSSDDDQSQGGAIYLDASNAADQEILQGNYFENCTSSYSGGGLYVYCKDVKSRADDYGRYAIRMNLCTFLSCKSSKEGGAISSGIQYEGATGAEGDNDFSIYNSNFTKCESRAGGALFFQDGTKEGDEETQISNCYFNDCLATGGEGYAISCRSYKLSLSVSTFTNHNRGSDGANHCVVYINMNEAEVTPSFYGCRFENNLRSSLQFSCASAATIESITFSNSPLVVNDKWSTTQLLFKYCFFENNHRQVDGSISILSDSESSRKLLSNNVLAFNGCQFNNNSCKNGAGIYAHNIQQLYVDSCWFGNCVASEYGGGIFTDVETEIKDSNFSATSASKGAAIYATLNNNVKISNITIDIAKKPGVSAIFVTGGDSSKGLSLTGTGCFISSNRDTNDNTPDFIDSDSPGSIILGGDMCFSESINNSIKLPEGSTYNESWFKCNLCPAPEKPTGGPPIQPPTLPPTRPPSQSVNISASFTNSGEIGPDGSKTKSKGLSGGAIAGIVIGVLVFIALIVLLVLFILRRRNLNPKPVDVTSQEIASDNFQTGHDNPIWSEELGSNERPIYNPSLDNPSFETPVNEDPFIKDFEEGF